MPTDPNYNLISNRLFRLLSPFDRLMERGSTLLAAALVAVIPATFLTLWLILDTGAKRAFGWSAGLFGLVVLSGILWDALVARLLLWRFNREFPPSDPTRTEAIRLLSTNRLTTRAEERLLDMIRPRTYLHRESTTTSDTSSYPPISGPAIEPVPPAQIQTPVLWIGPQNKDTYSYIPLEPKTPPRDPPNTA
jgi:hypothetical protein